MFRWPFRSVRVRLLERDLELLKARIRDLEASRDKAVEGEIYFRARYERLADSVLFNRGEIAAPVHVEQKPSKEALGSRVMRVANAVGSDAGAFRTPHHASIAELPR
jgi:hypothetical protein